MKKVRQLHRASDTSAFINYFWLSEGGYTEEDPNEMNEQDEEEEGNYG